METESRYIVQVSHSFVFSFITSKNEYTSNIVGISDQYMFDSIFKFKSKSLIDFNVFQRNDLIFAMNCIEYCLMYFSQVGNLFSGVFGGFLFHDFLGVCRGAVAGVRSAFDRSPEEHHGRRDGGVHRRQTPASAASRL